MIIPLLGIINNPSSNRCLFYTNDETEKEVDMKRTRYLTLGLVTVLFLAFVFAWIASNRPEAVTAKERLADDGGVSDEGVVIGTPSPSEGSDEVLPDSLAGGIQAPSVFPTPIPGESLVYFIPTDNDATATVLYLYNTDSVSHIVALRGYSYSGVPGYSLDINIAASSFVRLTSDYIAPAPPPSWATPAPILTNFKDFTYMASLSLPKGVKAEGYVLFNGGTGTVDPRLDQGAIPLRFSTDPTTFFLPVVQSNP
jgi:hypothetical protein